MNNAAADRSAALVALLMSGQQARSPGVVPGSTGP
jgi:hypothetical protein